MYFPSDMNFQYFFFSTYPGFFLQVLPIALLTTMVTAPKTRAKTALCSGPYPSYNERKPD